MNNTWITGLASISLEVTDLQRSTNFYTEVWGMAQLGEEPGRRFFAVLKAPPWP